MADAPFLAVRLRATIPGRASGPASLTRRAACGCDRVAPGAVAPRLSGRTTRRAHAQSASNARLGTRTRGPLRAGTSSIGRASDDGSRSARPASRHRPAPCAGSRSPCRAGACSRHSNAGTIGALFCSSLCALTTALAARLCLWPWRTWAAWPRARAPLCSDTVECVARTCPDHQRSSQ